MAKTVEERLTERLERDGIFTYPVDIPIPAGARKMLEGVAWTLRSELESGDCYCQDGVADGGKCRHCEGVEHLRELERFLDPEHRTVNPDRLGNAAEAIFLEQWQKLQQRSPHVNGGIGTLEAVLTPTRQTDTNVLSWAFRPGYVPIVTQRDAEVAATVVQWLGTNCGGAFLAECERQVKAARAIRSEYEQAKFEEIQKRGTALSIVDVVSREVAAEFHRADGENFQKLRTRVAAAATVAADKCRAVLAEVVGAFERLVAESYGVAGLHRNGEVAEWSELVAGGRFEEWCAAFDRAAEFLKGGGDVQSAGDAAHGGDCGAGTGGDPSVGSI